MYTFILYATSQQNEAMHVHFTLRSMLCFHSLCMCMSVSLPSQIHSALNSMTVLYLSNKQQTHGERYIHGSVWFGMDGYGKFIYSFQQHATSAFKQLNVDLIFLQVVLFFLVLIFLAFSVLFKQDGLRSRTREKEERRSTKKKEKKLREISVCFVVRLFAQNAILTLRYRELNVTM